MSAAFHGLLVLGLLHAAPKLALPPAPPVEVQIVPTLPTVRAPPERTAAPAAAAPAAPKPAASSATPDQRPQLALHAPASAPRPVAASPPTPASPPAPFPSAPNATATPGPSGIPFYVGGVAGCEREDLLLMTPEQRKRCEDRIAAASNPGWLAWPDCAREHLARMTAEQRGECDKRLARDYTEGARRHVDRIPAEKRAYYDAVTAAYEEQRKGLPTGWYPQHDGPGWARGPRGMDVNVGIHLRCPFGAGSAKGDGIKVGPLPCAIHPPQGFLTEEAGIKPP